MSGPDKTDLYQALERPFVYRLAQSLLAPGADGRLTAWLARTVGEVSGPALDVACGPDSWLWRVGIEPIGLDISPAYTATFTGPGGDRAAVCASAGELPLADACCGLVFSLGLLHHLPDNLAARAVAEMVRVCAPGGKVVVFDGLLPDSALTRPLAWLIRKADRGRFMRTGAELAAVIGRSGTDGWRTEKLTYALTGLEGLALVRESEKTDGG